MDSVFLFENNENRRTVKLEIDEMNTKGKVYGERLEESR